MRKRIIIVVTLLLVFNLALISEFLYPYTIFSNESAGSSNKINNIPFLIKPLKWKIRNAKNFQEAFNIITKMYGQPDKDIGSGLYIPAWNIHGGTLTCYLRNGVTFSREDCGTINLIDANNKVEDNIIGNYYIDITSTNDASKQYRLGTLQLNNDGKYSFSAQAYDSIIKDINYPYTIFFSENSHGRYTIEYQKNIQKDTDLESVSDGTIIAKINLISASKTEIFYIRTINGNLQVLPSNNKTGTFRSNKRWKNVYFK